MPFVETPSDLAEYVADKLCIYGACNEACHEGSLCRCCFVADLTARIRESVKNEQRLRPSADKDVRDE